MTGMRVLCKIWFAFEKRVTRYRMQQIKRALKHCGENVFLDPTCHILIPQQMEIGDNSSISSYSTIYAAFGVRIGKNCLISSNCGISSINHSKQSSNRRLEDDNALCQPVVIGDNVWIGMNACILPGVHIGNNAIIGSGSVVTRNVPANEVWVGNPARCIQRIQL